MTVEEHISTVIDWYTAAVAAGASLLAAFTARFKAASKAEKIGIIAGTFITVVIVLMVINALFGG